MGTKFADYEECPEGRREPTTPVRIRPATPEDVPRCAALARERDDGDWTAVFERALALAAEDAAQLLVAELEGEFAGYARSARVESTGTVPDGWYLLGVVVDPGHRRLGVGHALTRARLDWIAERSDSAYYFANVRNRVSIELHRALGFVELTREFEFPGLTFEGGVGILFRCDLRRRRAADDQRNRKE